MLELELTDQRGSFRLDVTCRLTARWAVLFGPSGAGKSTLLRLIAGLEKPVSGRIILDGRILTDSLTRVHLLPGRRQVGMVAQQPALFPHMIVKANIAYGLQNGQDSHRRIGEALELLGATHLMDRSPGDLSGGEAQRIALARAIAPMPRLLLLDEPLSALDASSRDEVLSQLQSWLREKKIQTLLVTHDAADALATEAEVVLLHEGKLADVGPADKVLAAERIRLIARLEGTQPPRQRKAR
jgi:ABC-type sulfate/molybdate transport systems ATPase subunit